MKVSSPILTYVLRGLQFAFGIVVLGLSATLISGHKWGSTPPSLVFAATVGGISILGALIGLAASWVSFLQGIFGLVIDGLVALVNIAGGVYFAIRLGGVQCKTTGSDENSIVLLSNDWFNGGMIEFDGELVVWVIEEYFMDAKKAADVILGHCRESQAACVLMFLTAAVFLIGGMVLYLRSKKRN